MPTVMMKVGPAGRVVIPAEVRRRLGVKPGDELIAIVEEDGSLRVMTRRVAMRQAREMARPYLGGRDPLRELRAARRRAAAEE